MGLSRNRKFYQTLCILVQIILLVSFGAVPVISSTANVGKKLDQELVPQVPDTSIQCGTCPCVNPCSQRPPPPPPSPPPPPPPTTYCPQQVQTPPPPRFIYITGEPGGLYHTEADDWGFYSTAQRNAAKNLLFLAGCGVLLFLLIIW